MKRLLFATLCLLGSLELYSQSPKSVREEYPDDMYTTIDGKEVRVNTLPQRLIDSLEALPPMKRFQAIYKVETVDRAEELNKPSEVHKISEYDYWERKSVERIYYVYRNIDGTTKIEDDNGNWMLFKTEYPTNEYTGEKSSTPIDGKTYCGVGGKKDIPIIRAYRILPNGYKLEINGEEKEITLTNMALGISYTTKQNQILSDIWYEWKRNTNFSGLFNSTFYDKGKMIIKGKRGDVLENCKNITFSDLIGGRISGGLYDKETHCMYYGLEDFDMDKSPNGRMMKLYPDNDVDRIMGGIFEDIQTKNELSNNQNIESQKRKLQIQEEIASLEKEMDALKKAHQKKMSEYRKKYPLNYPQKIGHEIKLLTDTYDKNERAISGKLGTLRAELRNIDSNKVRVLKSNNSSYEALDITLVPGLPSDKIKEIKKGENVSEIYYENGDYLKISKLKNGEVFEGKAHRPQGIWTIKLDENNKVKSSFVFTKGRYKDLIYEFNNTVWTMAILDMEKYLIRYGARLYSPSEKRWLTVLRETGEIEEYLKEEQAKRDAIAQAKKNQQEEAIYSAYCKKYGKSNVDNILDSKIHTGMPFSVVKAMCVTELTDEMGTGDWYRVYYAGSKYDYANNRLQPQDVRYAPKAFLSYWLVRVSNGVVQSVHRMKIY